MPEMITTTLPEELFIQIPESTNEPAPFLLGFIEIPNFGSCDVATLNASHVTHIYSTGGNDVLDYEYND